MTKQTKLFPAISKLCGQLAAEQMRRQTWERARALRQEFEQRILAGASVEVVQEEIEERLRAALIDQLKR